MKKRVFDLTRQDIKQLSRPQIVDCIARSEGRTMMVENVVSMQPPVDLVTGAEMAAALGADMITLNCLDMLDPKAMVLGHDAHGVDEFISIIELKKLCGRLMGCNLEPVPQGFSDIAVGRSVTPQTVQAVIDNGLDYVMLTGNPGMQVSQETILDAIQLVRAISQDLVIVAGKMHGGGIGNDYNLDLVGQFAQAGADIMMFPAPYTTPGVTPQLAQQMMQAVHQAGMLGMLAIGTSQEGAEASYIQQVAMASKAAGADIVHIGDGGYGGLAVAENIVTMGITLRGRRHQFKRMANRR